MEERIKKLEAEISEIRSRNRSVEGDKAWETSLTRKAIISIFTYLSIGIYMWAINIDRAWLNAIVPACGFLLSTLTLNYFKNIWLNNRPTR